MSDQPYQDFTEALTGELVNNSGWHAALEALMMDDPHPQGWISDSPAARLSRALYAYEWAKREYPLIQMESGRWTQRMPEIGAARAAVMAKEATE